MIEFEAMEWLADHHAITRFFEQDGQRMVRVTVEHPTDPEQRVTRIKPVPPHGPAIMPVLAQCVAEVKEEFNVLDRRKALRVVA